MTEHEYDEDENEELPDELLETARSVVESHEDAADDHRDGSKEAEQFLVNAVVDRVGFGYEPGQFVEAVREVTGGGPVSAGEVRAGVAEELANAQAGIAVYVGFEDGEITVQGAARWFDDDAMTEVEQVAAEALLETGYENHEPPTAPCTCGECEDGGVSAAAIPVSAEGLGGLLGGMGGGDHDDGDDLDSGAAFQ